MFTSLEGLGAVLPPPITNMRPLKLSALVSPVARGMLAMVEIESATGSYTKELLLSWIVVPSQVLPPPV